LTKQQGGFSCDGKRGIDPLPPGKQIDSSHIDAHHAQTTMEVSPPFLHYLPRL